MCDGSCDDGVCDCVSDDECVILGGMLCVKFLDATASQGVTHDCKRESQLLNFLCFKVQGRQ